MADTPPVANAGAMPPADPVVPPVADIGVVPPPLRAEILENNPPWRRRPEPRLSRLAVLATVGVALILLVLALWAWA